MDAQDGPPILPSSARECREFVSRNNACCRSDQVTRREFGTTVGTAVAALSVFGSGFPNPSQAAEVLASGGPGAPPSAKPLADGTDPFDPARIKRLQERGESKVYRGEYLDAIRFLVGGIGAGALQLDGKARIAAWQIFNNFDERQVESTFFAVFAKAKGQTPVVRALQTEAVGPFQAIPSLEFQGEYPLGQYRFQEPELPVRVAMETFNPLIPLNVKDSAIPCAIFKLTAENPGDAPADVSFLSSISNEVRSGQPIGGDLANTVLKDDPGTLHLTGGLPTTPAPGDMAVTIVAAEVDCVAHWKDLALLFREFAASGRLKGPQVARSTGPLHGAMAAPFRLAPGEKRAVTVILTWYFPVARLGGPRDWQSTGANMYTHWWPSALAVARDVRERLNELEQQTRLYHETLYATDLPYWLLDRLSSQTAVLKSRTCFWLSHGYFGAWEGCAPEKGCCGGNCGHVWHYAQAHARLFPELARQMRLQDFDNQLPDGSLRHRHAPGFGPATDGHLGAILSAYREHLLSPGATWLAKHWPQIRNAMEYAVAKWDSNEDGVLEGIQWNTLDCQMTGSSSWMGTLYLAALAACERMARLQGDNGQAARYAAIRRSGATKQDEQLWNGQYYVQIPDGPPQRDYLSGCHIDQVLGQWWAHQLDLGWVYPPERVREALASIVKYNFHGNFVGIHQGPRKFVDDPDAGTKMITWPKGELPPRQNMMNYGDEIMTGFEYAASVAMVQAGMLDEGLVLERTVYDRYDGRLRRGLDARATASWGYSGNPFGDDECGKFYARSMSNWSLLLALQGFIYDGPAGRIGFLPLWNPGNHASFFTAVEGWGLFRQKREAKAQTSTIAVRYGRLVVRQLVVQIPPRAVAKKLRVAVGSKEVAVQSQEIDGQQVTVTLQQVTTIKAGETIEVQCPIA